MIATSMWTRANLEHALRDLGLQTGQTLIVHSSLKSIGWVVGGARSVVDALLAVLGPSGTLVMPAQSGDNSEPSLLVCTTRTPRLVAGHPRTDAAL